MSQDNEATAGTRLTEQSYWESVHGDSTAPAADPPGGPPAPRGWRRLFGRRLAEFFSTGGYAGYLLREVVLGTYLPNRKDWKVLEVGSAPGHHLIELHDRFGYEPYGVEYTDQGVEVNRRVFAGRGLDPSHVIHADFFSPEFQDRHRGAFDVVCSHGFIEHFADPRDAVRKHLDLLRPGGRLVVTVPNLRGLNYWLVRFFHPEVIPLHNLGIMSRAVFASLFAWPDVRPLCCRHLGVSSLGMMNTDPRSWKRHVLRLGTLFLERPGDLFCRLVFPRRHPTAWWFSPYLVFVGEKLDSAGAVNTLQASQ